MYDVIALGELLVDLAERTKDENGYPTLAANPGGAPGNFLAALSAYGKKTAFLAKVGDDTFGHLLTGTMRRAGIDTRGILISSDTFTTLAFVTFDAARRPLVRLRAQARRGHAAALGGDRPGHAGTKAACSTSARSACTDEPARTATQKAAAYATRARQARYLRPQLPRPAVENRAGGKGADPLGPFAGGYRQDQR